jgi:hypothetical protein
VLGNPIPKLKAFDLRTPGNITFVRNRMLYARAALNSKGEVHIGLRHIRQFPDMFSCVLKLIESRCPESIFGPQELRAYSSRNEIYFSTRVWAA